MAAVVVDNLSHAFGQGEMRREVLQDISFRIEPGEVVLLTGPSGCGKTTLLTLIGALRTVQQGEVSVLGESPGWSRPSAPPAGAPAHWNDFSGAQPSALPHG